MADLNVKFIIDMINRSTAPARAVTRNFEEMRKASVRANRAFAAAANMRQAAAGVERFASAARKAVAAPTSAFEEFQQAIAELKGVSQLGADAMARLENEALKLGTAVGEFDPTGAARGMIELARASFTEQEIMQALPHLLDLSTASTLDLASTIKTVTDVMGGYGFVAKDTERVSNVMTAAANASKTDFQGLAETLSYAGPILREAGYSFEETATAAGLLANASLGASRGGTTLRAVISRLSGAARGPGAKILQQMGVQITEMRGGVERFRLLPELLSDINKQLAGKSLKERLGMFGRIFGAEAAAGAASLARAVDGIGLDKLNAAMQNTTGRTKQMADEFRKTGRNETMQLTSAVNTLNISIGRELEPQISAMKRTVIDIVQGLTTWSKEHPKLTKVIGLAALAVAGLATGLSTLLFTMVGVTSALGVMSYAMGTNKTGVQLLGGAIRYLTKQHMVWEVASSRSGAMIGTQQRGITILAKKIFTLGIPAFVGFATSAWSAAAGVIAATWPILAIIAAIAAVTAAVYFAVKYWDELVAVWDRFRNASMKTKIILGLLLAPFVALASPIIALANVIRNTGSLGHDVWTEFKNDVQSVIDVVTQLVNFVNSFEMPDWFKRFGEAHLAAGRAIAGFAAGIGREASYVLTGNETTAPAPTAAEQRVGGAIDINVRSDAPVDVRRMRAEGGIDINLDTGALMATP